MRIAFWGNRGWQKELAMNPEVFIFVILLCLAIIIRRGQPGALGYYQILGLSIALGALWVVVFPRHLHDASPSDVAAKSILLLFAGGGIIFADWVAGFVDAIRLICAGKDESIAIPAWIWVIGVLGGTSGLVGLTLRKRLSFAIRSCSTIILRFCAALIVFTGILLVVRATMAGTELLRIGTGGQ